MLESRYLLAFSVAWNAGQLTVTGTPANDTINIKTDEVAGVEYVFVQGSEFAVPAVEWHGLYDAPQGAPATTAAVTGITVDGLAGDDKIYLYSVHSSLTDYGGLDDKITIDGGPDDDTILGSSFVDKIYGRGGDDSIEGRNGDDNIFGGDGNDILSGDDGADTIWGEAGADTIDGGGENDLLDGGDPDENDVDTIRGGLGDDHIYGGGGNDILFGGLGDDEISGGPGNDIIHGNDGDDIIFGDGGIDTLFGDGGNDELYIGYITFWNDPNQPNFAETADGGPGNDLLVGQVGGSGGNFLGGDGMDTIFAEGGRSTGGFPANSILGQNHDDTIFASEEDDYIRGGAGNDIIFARGGDDEIYGDGGDDFISGAGGDDEIYGDSGNDDINGGSGADLIDGGGDQPYGSLAGANPSYYNIKGTGLPNDGYCDIEDGHADIECEAPTVTATVSPAPSLEGQDVTLTGTIADEYFVSGSTQYDVTITWGDGSPDVVHSVTVLTFSDSHTYADDAEYTVDVTVIELSDRYAETQITHQVYNVAPTPSIDSGPASSDEGAAATFTGSATDPGANDTLTLAWEAILNGTSIATGSEATFTFTPDDNGSVEVTLTASDEDGGSASTTQALTVNNVDPTIGASVSPTIISESDEVTVTGTYSDPGTADTHTVTIDWGDGYGTPNTETFSVSGGTFTRTHAYEDDGPGLFNDPLEPGNGTTSDDNTITLMITDDDGGSSSSPSFTVTVNNVDPTVTIIGWEDFGSIYLLIEDPGCDAQTVTIDWGDGESETWDDDEEFSTCGGDFLYDFVHNYQEQGTYLVVVDVVDDDTGTGSDSVEVVIDLTFLTLAAPDFSPARQPGETISVETVKLLLERAMKQWTGSTIALGLTSLEVRVADLPGNRLAAARPGMIVVDVDAAGYGWFVDQTPTTLVSNNAAAVLAGHVDLLSAITHEVGHLSGYRHADYREHNVMGEHLALGVRSLQQADRQVSQLTTLALDDYFASQSARATNTSYVLSSRRDDDLRAPLRNQSADQTRRRFGPLSSSIVDAKLLDTGSPTTLDSGGGTDSEDDLLLGGDSELRINAETGELAIGRLTQVGPRHSLE